MTHRLLFAALAAALPSLASAQVVINEFVYDHSSTDLDEYIELYNAGSTPVDISGWMIDGQGTTTSNYDVTLPAGLNPIAPGGFFLVANSVAAAPTLLAADYLVMGAPGTGWLQNSADSIMLRDTTGAIVDAVSYEVTDTSALVSSEQYEGAPIRGAVNNFGYNLGSLDYRSFSRYIDGADTDNNARDFRIYKATPGASNNANYDVAATPYFLDAEIAIGMLGAGSPLTLWDGSCAEPVVTDFATAMVPTSPMDGDGLLAQLGCGVTGIGGSAWLECDPATELLFEAYVYIETGLLATNQEELWHIGLQGSSAEFFNVPPPMSALFFGPTRDITGCGLTYVVDDTSATLYLVDYSDGSSQNILASMAAPSGWQRVRVQATGGAVEVRVGGTFGQPDGTVMTGAIDPDGALGGVFIGYRNEDDNMTINRSLSPLYVDNMIVSGGVGVAPTLVCLGEPVANTLGDPRIAPKGLPYIGNSGFGYDVSGLLPNANFSTLFGLSFPGGPIVVPTFIGTPPGFTLWVDALISDLGTSDGSGNGAFNLALPMNSAIAGLTFMTQAFQADAGLGLPIPLAHTKAYRMTIGNF